MKESCSHDRTPDQLHDANSLKTGAHISETDAQWQLICWLRHHKAETRCCIIRLNVHGAAMRFCDFAHDEETQPQALLALPHVSPEERLEKAGACRSWYRHPTVGHGEDELAAVGIRFHFDRLIRSSVGYRIGDKICCELTDPLTVTIDRLANLEASVDDAVGRDRSNFRNNLLQDWRQWRMRVPVQDEALAKTASRKI